MEKIRKIQKISKVENFKNSLKQQNQQELKNKGKEHSDFGSILDKEKRKSKEKEKKDELKEIYNRELQRTLVIKNKIFKQQNEKKEEIEQDER